MSQKNGDRLHHGTAAVDFIAGYRPCGRLQAVAILMRGAGTHSHTDRWISLIRNSISLPIEMH